MSEHFSAEFFRSSSVAWALPFRWPTSTFWMLVRCPRTDCLCSSSWLSWAIILASSVGSSTSSCAAWICVSSVSFWITSQNSESKIHVKHAEKTFVLEDSTFNATTWYHHSHDRDGLIQQKNKITWITKWFLNMPLEGRVLEVKEAVNWRTSDDCYEGVVPLVICICLWSEFWAWLSQLSAGQNWHLALACMRRNTHPVIWGLEHNGFV